jgi:ABC-type phosphate transport system ATPase subunit
MQYPSLKTLNLKNYKNLTMGNAPIELQQLNILIGPNCCGKSNLIGTFQFLKDCVTARADIGLTGLEVALDHLGGAKILNGKIARPAGVNYMMCPSTT